MARLPRLALAGHSHFVIQRGLPGQALFTDDADRIAYLAVLHKAAQATATVVYGWALLHDEVQLLLEPAAAQDLARLMQALARSHAARCNRRHRAAGSRWHGRYRCTVLEAGAWRLLALRLLDAAASAPASSSARVRRGGLVEATGAAAGAGASGAPPIHPPANPPEYWALGNTPFEREQAWRRLLSEPAPVMETHTLRQAALGGWALGSAAFVANLAAMTDRPMQPRKRGRPAAQPPRAPATPAG